eukprot:3455668-Rhodomonas_salina.2
MGRGRRERMGGARRKRGREAGKEYSARDSRLTIHARQRHLDLERGRRRRRRLRASSVLRVRLRQRHRDMPVLLRHVPMAQRREWALHGTHQLRSVEAMRGSDLGEALDNVQHFGWSERFLLRRCEFVVAGLLSHDSTVPIAVEQ